MGIETASLEKHFKSQNIDYYVNYLTVSLTPLKDFLWGGRWVNWSFCSPQDLIYCYKISTALRIFGLEHT